LGRYLFGGSVDFGAPHPRLSLAAGFLTEEKWWLMSIGLEVRRVSPEEDARVPDLWEPGRSISEERRHEAEEGRQAEE